jgi:hypothetical protein
MTRGHRGSLLLRGKALSSSSFAGLDRRTVDSRAHEGTGSPVRSCRSRVDASRSRRKWIVVTTCVLSTAAVATVVMSFGWRPVSSNQPASSEPAVATWSVPVVVLRKKQRAEFSVHFPGREFPGEAIFQVEPEVSAAGVKSVFQTVAFAGFPNITFAVDAGREPR